MAVLIEAISVIIKSSAIHEKFPGGDPAFVKTVPNQSLCADSELTRVGFMTPMDVEAYIEMLEKNGLTYLKDGESQDIVVIDQHCAYGSPCSWAEAGKIPMGNDPRKSVTACRLKGSKIKQLMCPDGWRYEDSLSSQYGFVPSEHVDRSLEFLRKERNMDVYLNKVTGEEVYVGRTSDRNMEKGE